MKIRETAAAGLMAALIAVTAPIAIPLAAGVPVSLATLSVMLAGALTGRQLGTLSVLIYLLLGLLGLPVFAGYTSGAAILFGMTGGYLFGYLPLAWLSGAGAAYGKGKTKTARTAALLAGMTGGTLVLYLFGTAWFICFTGMGVSAALAACVLPFLPGDFLKMAVVCVLVPRLSYAADALLTRP